MIDQDDIEDKVLRDYALSPIDGATTSIHRPIVQVAHFEIKPVIIQMNQNTIQFHRLSHEELNWLIVNFLKICDTFKQTGIIDDTIHMRLFPFYLRDKAKM